MLVYGIIMSIGGILLLYLGDELGMLNDYLYCDDLVKVYDDCWVNCIVVIDDDLVGVDLLVIDVDL